MSLVLRRVDSSDDDEDVLDVDCCLRSLFYFSSLALSISSRLRLELMLTISEFFKVS